jgi:hypothetical protein
MSCSSIKHAIIAGLSCSALLAAPAAWAGGPSLHEVDFPAGPFGPQSEVVDVPTTGFSAALDAEDVVESSPAATEHLSGGSGNPANAGVPPGDTTEESHSSLSPALLREPIDIPESDVPAQFDPQAAVSHRFIVAIDAHSYAFYDKKSGKKLTQTTSIPVSGQLQTQIFLPFYGKNSRYNVAQFLPPKTTLAGIYDARVIYDSVRNRFIFEANVRTSTNVRFTLIAVGYEEDPRAGFHEYVYTDGGDDPRIAVDDKHLAVASSDGALVFLFDADALAKGDKHPKLGRFASGTDYDGNVIPVNAHAPWPNHTLFLERPNRGDTSLRIYGFSDLQKKPIKGTLHLSPQRPPFWVMYLYPGAVPARPTYRNGKLYLTSWGGTDKSDVKLGCKMDDIRVAVVQQNTTAPASVLAPKLKAAQTISHLGACSVRVVGFEVSIHSGSIDGKSIADVIFGRSAPDDATGVIRSYGIPAIEVSKSGAVVAVYLRTQWSNEKRGIYPEARYSVLYPGEKGIRRSRLLHAGEWGDSHPKVTDTIIQLPAVNLDLAQAVVDPDDEHIVWMAHVYGKKNKKTGYELVVGAVKP